MKEMKSQNSAQREVLNLINARPHYYVNKEIVKEEKQHL